MFVAARGKRECFTKDSQEKSGKPGRREKGKHSGSAGKFFISVHFGQRSPGVARIDQKTQHCMLRNAFQVIFLSILF